LACFGFGEIAEGKTPVSKLTVPLPEFHAAKAKGESDAQILARVELEAENILGCYSRLKHEASIKSLPNGGYLNRVFEMAVITYSPRPPPGTEASVEAVQKRRGCAEKENRCLQPSHWKTCEGGEEKGCLLKEEKII
jgi:hypothetical protein